MEELYLIVDRVSKTSTVVLKINVNAVYVHVNTWLFQALSNSTLHIFTKLRLIRIKRGVNCANKDDPNSLDTYPLFAQPRVKIFVPFYRRNGPDL